MKGTAGVTLLLLTALGGCTAPGDHSPWTSERSPTGGPGLVPGVQGPWGTPVPTIGPSSSSPPGVGLSQSMYKPGMPLDMMAPPGGPGSTMMAQAPTPPSYSSGIVQAGGVMLPGGSSGVMRAGGMSSPGAPSGVVQAGANGLPTPPTLPSGMMPPPGVVPAAAPPGVSPLPPMQGMPPMGMGMPAQRGMPVLAPGMSMPGMGMGGPGMGMPGMGMPGMGMGGPGMGMPGMGMPGMPGPNGVMPVSCPPPGAVALAAGVGMPPGNGCGPPPPAKRSEVRFAGPSGMKVAWYTCGPDGHPTFAGNQLEAPGRYNFIQGAIYRLKLSDIPGRPGVDLYPTLEVVPSNFKTEAFVAHSAVPVYFTEEDLDQIAGGNYLVKVIYLPFPQYADVATTGPDEVVSTRLEPGADPIAEACKRGSILVVVRVGNIDLEAPNTPAMDAQPNNGQMCGPIGPGAMPPGMARMPVPPGMPMPPPGMPVGRPGPMLPNGGQMPAQPMNAPGGPALERAKPAGPVTQLPNGVPSVQPVAFPPAK